VLFSRKVGNDQRELEALLTRAGKAAAKAGCRVRWALDVTSGQATLLLTMLAATGQPVAYVPGRTVNRMAGAFAGEAKTDAKDARTIAETARLRGDLNPVIGPGALVGELQVLTARRADLMADWVRGVNRVRELLTSIFPALERAFDYSTRSALILLTGFQTPTGLRGAGRDEVAEHLRVHGAWVSGVPAMADRALAAAAEQTIVRPTEAAAAPLIARLAAQLLDLDREIKDLDAQITARFDKHADAPRITSVDGFGPILGAQLLADTAGDL
jgi:transposase